MPPFASRGSKRAWVTKWVTTGHDCRRRRWTFVDPWHAQTSPPPAQRLDLIRQRSAQVLAPARLAADLGGRAVRPGGPMAGAWRHVVPRTAGTRRKGCAGCRLVFDLDPWGSRSLACAGCVTGTRRMSTWGCSPSERGGASTRRSVGNEPRCHPSVRRSLRHRRGAGQ
jgi:hypothetical protein